MSRLNWISISVAGLLLLAAARPVPAMAQVTVDISRGKTSRSHSARPAVAEIRNIAVVPEAQGASIEIFSSRPVTPQITRLSSPPRLVVDIPYSVPVLTSNQIPVNRNGIRLIRIGRFRQNPPVTRVVLDLDSEVNYGMVSSGTQFTVELHPLANAAAGQQSVAQQNVNPSDVPPAAPYYSPLGSGNNERQHPQVSRPTQPAAMQPIEPAVTAPEVIPTPRPASAGGGETGTSLSAGADTAVMHLARGGELRVCPGTTLSVTPSRNGQELMLGISTGSFEVHYAMAAGSDTIVTPDFRMQLTGPGLFQLAFSADAHGNTCVHSLPSNQGSVTISEVMGDGTYTVRPNESVEFRDGRIAARDMTVPPGCGCPEPGVPVMRAENKPAPVEAPAPVSSVEPPHPAPTAEPPISVEAPLVFRGADPQLQPAPETANLGIKPDQERAPLQAAAPPAPTPAPEYKVNQAKVRGAPPKKGFFAKLRGFFSGIFH